MLPNLDMDTEQRFLIEDIETGHYFQIMSLGHGNDFNFDTIILGLL